MPLLVADAYSLRLDEEDLKDEGGPPPLVRPAAAVCPHHTCCGPLLWSDLMPCCWRCKPSCPQSLSFGCPSPLTIINAQAPSIMPCCC